jgi:hypothetical protein
MVDTVGGAPVLLSSSDPPIHEVDSAGAIARGQTMLFQIIFFSVRLDVGHRDDLDRIWDAIAKLGADPTSVAERLRALEAEKSTITQQLVAAEDKKKTVSIHPAAINNYLKDVAKSR